MADVDPIHPLKTATTQDVKMNEHLNKFKYDGDKPSPIVRAQRHADAARDEAAKALLDQITKNHADSVKGSWNTDWVDEFNKPKKSKAKKSKAKKSKKGKK